MEGCQKIILEFICRLVRLELFERILINLFLNYNPANNLNLIICWVNKNYLLDTYTAKSTNLLEYPHSLSYQATNFTNVSVNWIPAVASNIDV